ncbi:MAG TPA: heavy metal-associated domain-containing protein [Candidatus Binatia bacterium]|nr:heavy metal-associated domain-containing protein [Candidatus Binatia bacterium]
MKHQKFNITGMHCGACATGISMVWQNLDGVTKAEVSLDNKSGEVDYDETKLKPEDFNNAIKDMGYGSTPA